MLRPGQTPAITAPQSGEEAHAAWGKASWGTVFHLQIYCVLAYNDACAYVHLYIYIYIYVYFENIYIYIHIYKHINIDIYIYKYINM